MMYSKKSSQIRLKKKPAKKKEAVKKKPVSKSYK